MVTAALALVWSSPAGAFKVLGKVAGYEFLETPSLVRGRDPDSHAFSFREPSPSVPGPLRRPYPSISKELCVALLSTEAPGEKTPLPVKISGGRTTPTTVVVTPGTALEFKNVDPFVHRLYSPGVADFPPSETADGGTRQWIVPASGTFEIRDETTPSLQMWVVVEPNVVATAYPDRAGNFVLERELAGTYKLQAYFAGKPVGNAFELPLQRDTDLKKAPLVVATSSKAKE